MISTDISTERALNPIQLQRRVNQITMEKKKNLQKKNLTLSDNEIIILFGLTTTGIPNTHLRGSRIAFSSVSLQTSNNSMDK